MAQGGDLGLESVPWFNGGLFADGDALPLERSDIDAVLQAADLDWSEIDPSILGTLFERGLNPGKRAQLGAHYTDRDKIMLRSWIGCARSRCSIRRAVLATSCIWPCRRSRTWSIRFSPNQVGSH
jgi:hypothetical protein